ncbi:CCDC103 [Bugula neritina]|uniref:CCDC103 n=1 Tax=Bugula neritina TaxID=10212 RepID=A0A7J7JQD2_BUGNE|nr:CCDC103 [Bugula neritina]
MASLKDDSINFDKLENEVDEAMKAENLYWLQNDAKFRAVKQKGTYEEFKEIVAAAHLKPLAKNDKIQLEEKIVSPWNSLGSNSKSAVGTETKDSHSSDFTSPVSSQAFVLFWRKQKSHKDKASYLHKLLETGGPGAILTVFKNEIPFGLLGEFLISVSSEKEQFDSKILEMLLTTLAQTGRFNLSLSS